MGLRRIYDEKMDLIRAHIVEMTTLATEMIENALQSTLTGSPEDAEKVIHRDDLVDALEEKILRETVTLVMQEAPVAGDLKFLTATLGVIGELEKAADNAVKLARRSKRLSGDFPGEMRAALIDLAANAKKSLASAIRLYTNYDPELAEEIILLDDKIDAQFATARNRLVEIIKERPEDSETILTAIGIFHALEHIADHAVAIAKRLKLHYNPPTISLTDES